MMTEHDKGFSEARLAKYRQACAEASSEKFLLMPGIEYSDPDNVIHLLTWAPIPFLGETGVVGSRACTEEQVFLNSFKA